MEAADQVSERFLRSIRNQFYQENEKLFFQERLLLLQAITWPARYLDDRGVKLNAKRYTEILTTVIRTINRHGNLRTVRSFARYLLHAVQEHMKHHGEEYYEQAKAVSRDIAAVMEGYSRKPLPAQDNTTKTLADLHRLVAVKSGRKKQLTRAAQPQPDLFD